MQSEAETKQWRLARENASIKSTLTSLLMFRENDSTEAAASTTVL